MIRPKLMGMGQVDVVFMGWIPMTHRPESIFSFHSPKNLFPLTITVVTTIVATVRLKQSTPSTTTPKTRTSKDVHNNKITHLKERKIIIYHNNNTII